MTSLSAQDSAPSFPVTSCRAGTIVFLLSSTGVQMPVRIQLTQREEPTGLKHVTKVKATTGRAGEKGRDMLARITL